MQQEKGSGMPWTILGSAWLLAFAMFAPMLCVPPIEHILKEELLLTHTQTSLLFIAPFLMIVVVAIPGGLLADRIGIRKAAGMGAIIIAVGTVLRGTATSFSSLLAFTLIYGVGFGLSFPNLPKLVSAWVPKEKAVVATGIFTTGILAGDALPLAITMPLVFPVTNTFQGVFFIWSIPPIVAAILWWILVREPKPSSIHDEPASGDRAPFRYVLRNKYLWMVAILLLIENFIWYNWAGWSPLLMMSKGATPELAGVITSVMAWIGIPAVFLAPMLSYKIGLRKPFLWIPFIITAFLFWRAIYVSLSMSWLLMAIMGITINSLFPIILVLPVEISSKEGVGTATGLITSVGYLGGIIGPLVGGRILDLTGSLDLSLLVLTGITIVAAVIALGLPETGNKIRDKNL